MAENETTNTATEAEAKPKRARKKKEQPEPEPAHSHEHDHDHDHDHHHDHDHDDEVTFVEEPAFDVDYKGECAYEVKVTVPAANKRDQSDKMYEELKHDAEVPGFRRGKAPRKLIERKFAKVVRSEVDGKLVSGAFRKLIKDKDLRPIAIPDIDGLDKAEERKDDEPLVFTLKFEVAPKVELGKYRGIKVERPIVTVDDKDVDESLEEMRNRYATFETLTEGVAASGDQVVIDFQGTINDVPFAGGSASQYPYILGTKRFFPEFEDVLLGCSAGDKLTCEVTLPEDSPNTELRGKKATFTITVNDVKRRFAPELTEEFAKRAGAESLAALRESTKAELGKSSEATSDRIARARALDSIVAESTYEIPKTLIENVARSNYEEEVRRLISMRVPIDQIQSRMEELQAKSREDAVNDIKRMVTLNEIGEAEGIEVSDEDFENEAEAIALTTGLGTEAVSRYMAEEAERRNMYESRIFRAKAMNLVMEHAKVTDKEVPRDELDGEEQHEGVQ